MSGAKADFDSIYDQPDPRAYYETLGALDYQVPAHGASLFTKIFDRVEAPRSELTVLDVCCSYGVTAALMNHELDMTELYGHYAAAADAGRDEVLERDRRFYAERRVDEPVRLIGLDVAGRATGYAVEAGLLDDAVVADLESHDPDDDARSVLADVDLITSTGGIGYVSGATLGRLIDAADSRPTIAALTLRWIDTDDITAVLADRGYKTERVEDLVVPQRRFADDGERSHAFAELDRLGRAAGPLEERGWHAADLFLAWPADRPQAATADLVEPEDRRLVTPVSLNA
ncbi:MAG: hypothetical protein S0880_16765 [Actinomycetota bacterium]|nr:hypothetical protein [Actinomycetota bacterium]